MISSRLRALPSLPAAAVAVGGAAAALYLATLSRWYSADSLEYALALDGADTGHWLDPYHLALLPLALLWVDLWRALGWAGLTIDALQVLNAVAGGASIALVCMIAAHASGSLSAAVLAAAGCAVSGSLWLLSTEAEGVTIGLVAVLAASALVFRLEPSDAEPAAKAPAVGVAIGLATLVYATAALLLSVAALAYGSAASGRGFRLLRIGGLVLGFLVVVAPAAALLAGEAATAPASWASVLSIYGGDTRYGLLTLESLPRGIYAFLRSLVLYPGLGMNDRTTVFLASATAAERLAFAATYAAVAVVAAVPLASIWRHAEAGRRAFRRLLFAWAAVHVAFAFWWVPSDVTFWAPATVAWWIAVALLAARGVVPRAAVAGAALALLAANGLGLILPHRDAAANPPLQIALRLQAQLGERDEIVASPPVALFLRYFARREAIEPGGAATVAAAIAEARRRTSATAGRIFVAGVPLDEAERQRWSAGPAFTVGTVTVWQLGDTPAPARRDPRP